MLTFLAPFTVTSRPSRTILVCKATQGRDSTKAAPVLRNVVARLQEELPTLFSSNPDYSIYDPDVTFEDPLTKFRGISKYASNIKFLNNSPVFSSADLTLHDTAIITDDTIRTRWTLSMVVNLPWAPCVAFTGQSDYVVDLTTTKVIHHYDYWDSLADSKYFSFAAVGDLISQCRPHIGPRDLGGFTLLRRTKDFQIRKFDNAITLSKTSDSAIPTWQPAQDGDRLSCVAVLSLPAAPTSETDIFTKSASLRRLLAEKSFAVPTENVYSVRFEKRGQVFHEIWLEVTDVSAIVDT